ncbi:MAG: hypothetical protein H6563_06890 [Lewinellaceae bacterium]|nr:hypothetical protein [Lewinellaceae bacterium]
MKARLTVLFLLFSLASLSAQIEGEDPFYRVDTTGLFSDSLGGIVLDTSDVYWLYPANPYQEFALSDTLFGRSFMQYDPIRKGSVPRGNLGNLGTPAVPLFYQAPFRQGFYLGFDAYDYLRKPLDSLLFYRTGQAFTRATFSQGNNQENTAMALEFGREFGPGLGASLYYDRLNNQGAFVHQRAELTAFAFGLWFKPLSKRYQAFLRYGSNVNQLELNGGIEKEPTVGGAPALVDPITILVRTQQPQLRYADREVGLVQHFRVFSTERNKGKRAGQLDIVHDFRYQQNAYKFYDENPEPDSAFYGIFQTDQRGIRNFINHRSVRNAVRLHFFTSLPPDSTGIRQQRLRWEAGLVHTYHRVQQEPLDTALNNLFATFLLKWPIGKNGVLEGNAHLGLLANAGDYRVEGRWYVPIAGWAGLEAYAINQRYAPSLVEHQLTITQQVFWRNDFKSTIHTTLGGTLSAFKGNLKVSGNYHLVNFLVYFDSLGLAQQTSLPVNILQLSAWAHIGIGPLHFENSLYLQQATQDFLRLPTYYGAHSLYLQGKIFKKVMLSRLGIDLRLTGDFTPYAFQPLTGQFYLQDALYKPWQPLVDASLAFKVQKFRFLFRLENLVPLLTREYYYLVAGYPVPQMRFRVGISWQFVD